jgi:hypothetical protein
VSQFKASILLITFGMMMMLTFQNCAKTAQMNNAANLDESSTAGYVAMDSTDAQTLAAPFDGQCAANLAASSSYALQADGSTFAVSGGANTARADQLGAIQGMGDALIYGTTSSSRLGQVSSYRGNLQLCGMSVGSFDTYSYGIVAVEDGVIDSLSGYHGDIVLLSGDFPASVSGFSGHIVLKTSTGDFVGRTYYGDL